MIKENTIIKRDTPENWAKAKNFIPKKNEIIIYNNLGTKIGDGKTKINELPFIEQQFYSVEGTTLIVTNNIKEEQE